MTTQSRRPSVSPSDMTAASPPRPKRAVSSCTGVMSSWAILAIGAASAIWPRSVIETQRLKFRWPVSTQ